MLLVLRRFAVVAALILSMGGADAATYTVRKGDTLYGIARKHKLSVKGLMAANGIKDATKLQIGQKLRISGRASSSSRATGRSSKARSNPYARVGVGKRVVIGSRHAGYGSWGRRGSGRSLSSSSGRRVSRRATVPSSRPPSRCRCLRPPWSAICFAAGEAREADQRLGPPVQRSPS